MSGYSSSMGDLFDDEHGAIAFTDYSGLAVARLGALREVTEILRSPLPFRGMTSTLADLNRDGWLDVVIGGIDSQGRNLAIFRGGPTGFGEPEFLKLDMPVISSAVADLDGDGRLDLVIGGRGGWLYCPIHADGRIALEEAKRITSNYQIQRLTVADLNNDGFPEVIATHYREMATRRNAIDSAIYWNRGGHFSFDDRTALPTFGSHWVSVADLSGNGALDLLFSNYHGETTRKVDLFVYRPDAKSNYSAAGRFTLPALSSSANFVADIDGDGFQDIVVVNHTGPNIQLGLQSKSGVHGIGSYVYWGAKDGFAPDRRTTVASYGPHKTTNAEIGDILRRRPFETYTSPWVEAPLQAGAYELRVSGVFRGHASCGASFVIGDGVTWTELPATLTAEEESRFNVVLAEQASRVRYRLELRTGGAGTGPTVTAISLHRKQ